MEIKKALYIKLGEGGCWAKDSIETWKIRIGFESINIDLIKEEKWDKIKETLDKNDKIFFNALKNIIDADSETVFITFFSNKMYWCVAKKGSINEDNISKYLETEIKWSDKSINKERLFGIDQISGRITKYKAYPRRFLSIGNKLDELNYLKQIINNNETTQYKDLFAAKAKLKEALIPAIKNLIPDDFELLVDLLFRNFGWKRISVLGKTMKDFDIILEEPLKKVLHGVQIKSEATFSDYEKYKNIFIENYIDSFSSFFFVVHTPDKKLEEYNEEAENITLYKVEEIANHAIDSGLIDWIMEKARWKQVFVA